MENLQEKTLEADIVVVGGGSAGSTAAIRAQQSLPRGRVILLDNAISYALQNY